MNTRITYLDISKGIGMILAIAGYGSKISCVIFSFHMPLFYISGMCFNDKNESIFYYVKRKAQFILLPFFGYWVIYGIARVNSCWEISREKR